MKKLLLLAAAMFSVHVITAQWQPDLRFTFDPAISFTAFNYKSIAASGSIVHAVWYDERDGNFEIYYKRSPDEGVSWGADTRLTNSAGTSWFASLAVSGAEVHVISMDDRDGNFEIYYKRSVDGGLSWGPDTRLTNDTSHTQFPSISVAGSVVNVIWQDSRDGNTEIYYKRSPDGGISWGPDTRLTNDTAGSIFASVSAVGSIVNVTWEEYRDGNPEIYYKRSADGGLSWGADTRLTNNPLISFSSSVWASGSEVHVVWYDNRDGNSEIYYKRSPDGGISWGTDARLTNSAGGSFHPSVTASGSNVHVTWWDERDGDTEVYYKISTDAGISWGTDTRLTFANDGSEHPSVSVSGQVVHILWQDVRDGNYEIYYKRNPSGNPVGVSDTSGFEMQKMSIYPNPNNGTFYLVTNNIIQPGTIKAAV
ncbi:MAG TPA: sialidase family protein [Bacteroidia bacterium]|nr:sialidase family protein [Bacteroidia bacterium]